MSSCKCMRNAIESRLFVHGIWVSAISILIQLICFLIKADSAIKSFVSGGIGGVCSIIVGHPLDLIKVRLQTSGSAAQSSVFQLLGKTFADEGFLGLYRGVSAPLLAVTPMFAISFWSYDLGKKLVRYMNHETDIIDRPLSLEEICMASAFSAIPTSMIVAPSDRLKCLLQVQANKLEKGGKIKYSGLFDCAHQLYREGGIQSIYRGLGATLIRDVPGTIVYFATYEVVKKEIMRFQNLDPAKGDLSFLAIIMAGGLAGLVCWTIIMPADVIKSRYQSAPEGMYNGLWHVYRHLINQEGSSGLFRGMGPALLRAFPANAACFLGVEISKKILTILD